MSSQFAPPGYRFQPSDEVIIKHYLIPKIEGKHLPSDHIYETTEIYGEAPQDLEITFQEGKNYYSRYAYFDENCDSSLYFFTKLKKRWESGSRISRTAGGGTWTGDNAGKEIYRYPPYKVEKRKLSLTDNAVKDHKRKYLTLTSDGYFTWNMEEYSVEKDNKKSDYAIVKITRKKSNNKFSKSSSSQTVSSCSNYEVTSSEVVGKDDFEVHDAVPQVPPVEDNQLPVDGQAEPEYYAGFQDWLMNNTCISFEDEGPVPVLQDAVLPTDQPQQLQSCGDPVDYGIPNLDFSFDSHSLLSAIGPVAADSFGAIGEDNAASPFHNQEGSSDILRTISSAEAVKPVNESWAISDEELFSGLENYRFDELLPDF